MENNIITFGRYKNKTFQEIYDSDKEYCKMVLNSQDKGYRGDTSAFKEFLKKKFFNNNSISETLAEDKDNIKTVPSRLKIDRNSFLNLKSSKEVDYLLKPFPPIKLFPFAQKEIEKFKGDLKLIMESDTPKIEYILVSQYLRSMYYKDIFTLKNIIGELELTRHKVHPKVITNYQRSSNYEYGLFYCMFFKKYLYNLNGQNAMSHKANKICFSFPFELHWDYVHDDSVNLEIFSFLDEALLEDVGYYMSRYYFKIPDLKKEIKHLFIQISHQATGDDNIKRLLDIKYYLSDKRLYIETLKKFLFFYALCKEYNEQTALYEPYMRLDDETPLQQQYDLDTLWKDVESYRIYQFYKGDLFDILPEIFRTSCLALMHYYADQPGREYDINRISKQNLQHIKDYTKSVRYTLQQHPNVEVVPSFKQFEVNEKETNDRGEKVTVFKVDTYYLMGADEMFLVNNDTLMLFVHSLRSKDNVYDFFKLILYAVMLNFPVKKLTIYNSCYGEQTTANMIEDVEPIKVFIRERRDPNVLFSYLSKMSKDVKYNDSGEIEVRLVDGNNRNIDEEEANCLTPKTE